MVSSDMKSNNKSSAGRIETREKKRDEISTTCSKLMSAYVYTRLDQFTPVYNYHEYNSKVLFHDT